MTDKPTIKMVREALGNSRSLLKALGSPDDAVLRVCLNELDALAASLEGMAFAPATIEIAVGRREVAVVDFDVYASVCRYRWCRLKSGHVVTHTDGGSKRRKMLSLAEMVLPRKEGLLIDHINGDTLDNRRINLRYATKQQNAQNMKPKPGTSAYKGVSLHYGKWRATIRNPQGKKKYLGSFNTESEAAAAYNKFALRWFGEFAWLNDLANPGQRAMLTASEADHD